MVCSDMKTGSEILASTKFLYDRFSEALKVLGAGNGTGTLALIAALHSFYDKPHILGFLKSAAAAFAIGVLLFAVAYTLFMFAYMHLENYTSQVDKAVQSSVALSSWKPEYPLSMFSD
jgi:hypothetical protein